MPAIEIRDLTKRYGEHLALAGISLEVDEGEVVGLLGPNGAGKSTAMKILTGFLAPTSGSARIRGHDVLAEPVECRRLVGYLPESAPIYPEMTVRSYLDFVGRVRGLGRAERVRAIGRVAEECGIADRLDQPVGTLSKGYRQRTGLAQALLHGPPILILDEPTTGLDPNQIVDIRSLIREIGRRRTVLLSTHILGEVQATCDRVVIIHHGRIVADGATDEVTTRTRGGVLLRVVYAPGAVALPAADVRAAVEAVDGVDRVRPVEAERREHVALEVLARSDVREALFRLAVDRGLVLLELERERSNLEEVFRRLTTDEGAAVSAPAA